MSAKITNSNRYKKTTKLKVKQARMSRENELNNKKYNKAKLKKNKLLKANKQNIKDNLDGKLEFTIGEFSRVHKDKRDVLGGSNNKKLKGNLKGNVKVSKKIKKATKTNEKKVKNVFYYFKSTIKVISLIGVLVCIGIVSKKIVQKENQTPITEVYSNKNEKITLAPSYDLKIGVSKLDTTDVLKTKNVILNELYLKTKNQFLSINKDYSINYLVAKKIEKVNNKEFLIDLNPDFKYSVEDIKNSVNEIKNIGDQNIYYKDIQNIEEISDLGDNQIKVRLKIENSLFIYTLDFPIIKSGSSENLDTEYNLPSKTDTELTFIKNKSKSTLNSLKVLNYLDTDDMINDFRDEKIDMFFASSDSIMQLVGKHEYNIKKYRDGEAVFLLGNKDSVYFSRKEIRQAIAYSLNRDEIVKKINSSFSEVIDLPYIYSDVKYKYDIYGAENVLLSNGWKKVSGVYNKQIDNQSRNIELNLLVNSGDSSKVKIADLVKQMVEQTGIKINIIALPEAGVKDRINAGDYDIVLADVYINDYPDISYLEKYINLNSDINNAIEQVNTSDYNIVDKNMQNLQSILSSEVACIGIMARTTNVVYQKDISGFENTGYMRVFDLEKIGQILEIKSEVKNENEN